MFGRLIFVIKCLSVHVDLVFHACVSLCPAQCALVFLIITPSLTLCFPNKLLIACQRIFPRTNSLGASNLTSTKYHFYHMATGWICFLHFTSESVEVNIYSSQHRSWVQGGCLLIVWQWIDHQGNLTVEVPVDWSTVTPYNPLTPCSTCLQQKKKTHWPLP